MRRYVGASLFAGRAEEAALLVAGVQDAAQGQLRAVLVHGEPGVGKTRLVSEVCSRQHHSGTSVLWGQCVHFGATPVPYLPLVSAFEDWTMGRSNALPEVGALLAALSGTAPPGSTRLIRIFDAAVNAVTDDGPAVLVVDDVQWADTSTLDLLAYTISSVRPRRLAVLMTYRDTELAEGHHLHGWLGDVCRLPGVSDMRLGRLSREEMETQAAALLGQRPRLALVDAVMARSDGNPYLTQLLLRDVAPNAETLADGVPAGLRTALLAAWHRLGAGARQLARMLATGQRPLGEAELQAVARHVGLTPHLEPALQEAIGAGVIVRDPTRGLMVPPPAAGRGALRDASRPRTAPAARGLRGGA